MSVRGQRRERGGIITTLVALLFLALLCAGIYLARHPLLRFAGGELIVEDPLEKSDAIIVLSDDNFYADRVTRAAELYRQGLAPVVVASGVRLRPYAGISELMTHDLIERGVPKEHILAFPQDADNTREEALALKTMVAQKNWKSVIIVTSNYHTRRARFIFGTVFPSEVRVEIASARDADFDPNNWYEHRRALKRFAHEVSGLLVAHWER
jgi:uncharacterized SAM-binding protein YcdF (DUF218 family)